MCKVIFMGTPEFACSILQQLIDDQYNIVAVVTQPDKKVGRKQEIAFSPVKKLALENGIDVIQPISIRNEYEDILNYQPDLIVTCAYGQIVPEAVLQAPKYGCVNVHASLLPRLRGGAPIHKAIMYGEEKTGVTLMYMVKKLDAGDMLSSREVLIDDNDTVETLHDKLAVLGANIIHEDLPKLINGELKPIPQKEEEATYAWNVSKEEEFVNFEGTQQEIYNHIRSLISWPCSYGIIEGKKMKFWKVRKGEVTKDEVISGTIVRYEDGALKVKAGEGYIYLDIIQLEGKSKMLVKDFMNGNGSQYIGKIFAHSM